MAGPPTILVVDDDPPMRRFLQLALEAQGYRVCVAKDGLQALDVLRDESVDLVLTDCVMPRMTGTALLTELRARGYQMPVVLISAINTVRAEAVKYQVNGILTKPFALDDLYKTLQRLLPAANTLKRPAAV